MHYFGEDTCGFDRARTLVARYDARVLVYEVLSDTSFLDDSRIAFVHVDNTTRADRMTLTGCDALGSRVATDVHYDDFGRGMQVVPEFSLYCSGAQLVPTSDLDTLSPDGWIVDLSLVRGYDQSADRSTIQRASMMEHLKDMVADGSVRSLGLGLGSTDD